MKTHNQIRFVLDGEVRTLNFSAERDDSCSAGGLRPSTPVLNYLRSLPGHRGVKEGCAEGDCGACTVVLAEPDEAGKLLYRAFDSCLLFLPVLHGRQLITVENLAERSVTELRLHPVQQLLVDLHGSQCGYCTPGIVMSMFALFKKRGDSSEEDVADALTGNLCRCTGYRPVFEAALKAREYGGSDRFSAGEAEMSRILKEIKDQQASVVIRTGRQSYFRPAKLSEALKICRQHPGAVVFNGATDVALRQTKKHEFLKELLDLSGLTELDFISETGSAFRIGSGVTMEALRQFSREKIPVLAGLLSVFASLQIRNAATLGGNIGSASPIGDLLPLLFAMEAKVVLFRTGGRRILPISDFITGYRKTALEPGELIHSVLIPKLKKNQVLKTYKISKRHDLDISTVSAGFKLKLNRKREVEEIILCYGGMAEITKRAVGAEISLIGKKWERKQVEETFPVLEHCFQPISDARAGKEFRMQAAKNLLLKFYLESEEI